MEATRATWSDTSTKHTLTYEKDSDVRGEPDAVDPRDLRRKPVGCCRSFCTVGRQELQRRALVGNGDGPDDRLRGFDAGYSDGAHGGYAVRALLDLHDHSHDHCEHHHAPRRRQEPVQ